MLPQLRTIAEVAKALGVKPGWVKRAVRAGTLRSLKLQTADGEYSEWGRVRIYEDSVAKLCGIKVTSKVSQESLRRAEDGLRRRGLDPATCGDGE